MAPEIEYMKKEVGYKGHYVDIFNSGIILFCMIFQRMPFSRAVAADEFYRYIMADKADSFWKYHRHKGLILVDTVSPSCKSLIFSLLQTQPELRPSCGEILQSEWFRQTPRMTNEQKINEFTNRRNYNDMVR